MIAEGTSDDLEDRVGGERLEVTPGDGASPERDADALAPLALTGRAAEEPAEREDGDEG